MSSQTLGQNGPSVGNPAPYDPTIAPAQGWRHGWFRTATDGEVANVVASNRTNAWWVAIHTMASSYYGPLAARVKIDIEQEYDDEGSFYPVIRGITVYDAQNRKLEPDLTLPKCSAILKGDWPGSTKPPEREHPIEVVSDYITENELDQLDFDDDSSDDIDLTQPPPRPRLMLFVPADPAPMP